jgi:hypothetical protein
MSIFQYTIDFLYHSKRSATSSCSMLHGSSFS